MSLFSKLFGKKKKHHHKPAATAVEPCAESICEHSECEPRMPEKCEEIPQCNEEEFQEEEE